MPNGVDPSWIKQKIRQNINNPRKKEKRRKKDAKKLQGLSKPIPEKNNTLRLNTTILNSTFGADHTIQSSTISAENSDESLNTTKESFTSSGSEAASLTQSLSTDSTIASQPSIDLTDVFNENYEKVNNLIIACVNRLKLTDSNQMSKLQSILHKFSEEQDPLLFEELQSIFTSLEEVYRSFPQNYDNDMRERYFEVAFNLGIFYSNDFVETENRLEEASNFFLIAKGSNECNAKLDEIVESNHELKKYAEENIYRQAKDLIQESRRLLGLDENTMLTRADIINYRTANPEDFLNKKDILTQNLEDIHKKLQDSVTLGVVDANFELAIFYSEGFITSMDFDECIKKAFSYYLKAAESGDVNAMKCISNYYGEGIGCRKDICLKMNWLIKAAEKGDSDSLKQVKELINENRFYAQFNEHDLENLKSVFLNSSNIELKEVHQQVFTNHILNEWYKDLDPNKMESYKINPVEFLQYLKDLFEGDNQRPIILAPESVFQQYLELLECKEVIECDWENGQEIIVQYLEKRIVEVNDELTKNMQRNYGDYIASDLPTILEDDEY